MCRRVVWLKATGHWLSLTSHAIENVSHSQESIRRSTAHNYAMGALLGCQAPLIDDRHAFARHEAAGQPRKAIPCRRVFRIVMACANRTQ